MMPESLLASALRQLLEQTEERRRLGLAGHAAVRDRFDAATMARETVRARAYRRADPA